jgi:hypothetical protein
MVFSNCAYQTSKQKATYFQVQKVPWIKVMHSQFDTTSFTRVLAGTVVKESWLIANTRPQTISSSAEEPQELFLYAQTTPVSISSGEGGVGFGAGLVHTGRKPREPRLAGVETGQLPERGEQIVHNCRNHDLPASNIAAWPCHGCAHPLMGHKLALYWHSRGYPCGARGFAKPRKQRLESSAALHV